MDERFDKMDERFDKVDAKIEETKEVMNLRFEYDEKRISNLEKAVNQ